MTLFRSPVGGLIALSLAFLTFPGPSAAELNDKETAVAQLEQNVKANPHNTELWLHLGFAYRKVDNMPRAEECFQKVLSLDPKNRDAMFMMGLIYEKKRQTQDALRLWKQFLTLETEPGKREVAEKHIHQLSQ